MAQFESDEEKNRRNLANHGISFEGAKSIWEGYTLSEEDDGDDGELRERTYGLLRGGVVVVCVIHTLRDETIRIISARKATPRERKQFDDHYG
jgi:uncharacterized DUF497 family protein